MDTNVFEEYSASIFRRENKNLPEDESSKFL
jgi:hypothetical protein